jgi:cell division septation protein DedD
VSETVMITDPASGAAPRKSRLPKPRTAAITVTIRRQAVVLVACALVFGVAAAFGLGFLFGRAATSGAPLLPARAGAKAPGAALARGAESDLAIRPVAAVATAEATRPPPVAVAAATIVVGTPDDLRSYGVQTGAYPTLDAARASVAAFQDVLDTQRVFIVPVEIKGRGLWHRVRIGAFTSKTDAEALKRSLPDEIARGAMVVSYK